MDEGTAMPSAPFRPIDKSPSPWTAGYTLLEVMVVLAIVAILATQVGFAFSDPMAKVKAAAFKMRSDMNLARAEAIGRHKNILVEFVPGDIDGYRICVDGDAAGDPDHNKCTNPPIDTIIKEVWFNEQVQFLDRNISNGPTKTPKGDSLNFENGTADDDGIAFSTHNYFNMEPNGISSSGGAVYIFAPKPGDAAAMRAPPITLVVTSHTGRVRLMRWRVEEKKWRYK